MANPNIASIGELYGGTLAWSLSPSQVVYAYGSWFSQVTTSGWGSGSQSLNLSASNFPNAFSNRILFIVGTAGWTWSNDFGTRLSNLPMRWSTDGAGSVFDGNYWSNDRGGSKLFYWLNPTGGSAQTLTISFGGNWSNYSNRSIAYGGYTLYNVKQSDPFTLQLHDGATTGSGAFQGKYASGYHYYGNSSTTKEMTANPGDAILLSTGHERYVNGHSFSTANPSGGDITDIGSTGSYDERNRNTLVHAPTGTTGSVEVSASTTSFGSSSNYDYSHTRMIGLNGADATELLAVPTGYIAKINQIYATGEGPGLSLTVQVQGLSATGATPNTIHDSAGNDIITAASNVAVGTITKGLSLVAGVQNKILTQPIWLSEGNKLAASIGYSEGSMLSATQMRPTPKCNFVVALDIIKQSA